MNKTFFCVQPHQHVDHHSSMGKAVTGPTAIALTESDQDHFYPLRPTFRALVYPRNRHWPSVHTECCVAKEYLVRDGKEKKKTYMQDEALFLQDEEYFHEEFCAFWCITTKIETVVFGACAFVSVAFLDWQR